MNPSTLPPITLSSLDVSRLESLLEAPEFRDSPAAVALGEEIGRATVLPPERMPANVVTMNSTVDCVDDITGDTHPITLVYPSDADAAVGKVSVLAPVGTALLGLSVDQQIDWQGPGGRPLRLRVVAIRYQPEAAGDLAR
ncbi:MAG: nucleoside diphosphate kinase regulator [Arenimonas sp.]|uniref:nucleoside diphosphate kinase regulator n=1 Tax=Arenimonas sp. TaxID=1872635 RepID=UPI0025C123C0|nr:nucleoside diphosphate kinase regulator [Arenimonas sp.]MBW8367532.1 nucleoside diphosphate kinase regulator [Arenimonas sp.]